MEDANERSGSSELEQSCHKKEVIRSQIIEHHRTGSEIEINKPCKYHMYNKCKKGKNCNFSHKMAEDLQQVQKLETVAMEAIEESDREIFLNPKNWKEEMEKKTKLHLLKKNTMQALKSIKRKIWRGELTL